MLILLLIISIICFIICYLYLSCDYEFICALCLVGGLVKIAIMAILIGLIVNGRVLDKKITMYEEENTKIEKQIATVVEKYMDYEHDTFTDCSTENMIALVDLYPELKSDTLVSKQIDIYINNNNEIKSLRNKKLNISNYRWWVYFGK